MALFLALLGLLYWFGPFQVSREPLAVVEQDDYFDELIKDEITGEHYYRMVDQEGRTIVITGRRLRVGDRYLSSDNRLYEVSSVEEYIARARFVEEVELNYPKETALFPAAALPTQGQLSQLIAIYHSHNAESYVPSDGTDSIYGRGGIHDVGVAFREALEEKGINVIHSEQFHLPHDRGAYRRSRVTATELLRRGPDAIFDVHRDAAPWEAYALELDGEWITQIQFVVGLSNPGSAANRNYAYDLKGYADRVHPGLVRGIFLIWGSYNQDLSPMNLLLEVGAHTNDKESAMRGITLFADVVAFYFYGPEFLDDGVSVGEPGEDPLPPALYRDAGGILRTVSGTVISLLLTSLGAALGFYFLNNPGALEKFYQWWENLPERAVLSAGKVREFLIDIPERVSGWWNRAPDNLRFSWLSLRDDAIKFPGQVRRLIPAINRLLLRTLHWSRRRWREAPGNLKHAWINLKIEGRNMPAETRALFARLSASGARLGDKVSVLWGRAKEDIAVSAAAVREEAVYLGGLVKEKILFLRNRLRP